jgi:hypothetical protein
MNDPVRKRTSPWKIVGIIVGMIVLSIVGLVLYAGVAGARKFERMKQLSLVRLAEVRNADARRPVLRGTAEAGNAWDDYLQAQAEVKKFAKAGRLGLIVDRSPKEDPAIAKEALAAHGVAIDHLRRGAGRASSRYAYEWEKGVNMPLPPMSLANQLASLGVLQGRAFAEDGKPREAAGVLLDVCQYGRDFGADGTMISYMIGVAILANSLNEIRDHLGAGKFDKVALEDLDRGLETLDGSYPSWGQTLINEALLFGGLLNEEMAGGWGPQRMLYADAVERIHEAMVAAAKADLLPWLESQAELQRIETASAKAWNPISSIAAPSTVRQSAIARQRRAHLRALRIGLHWASTGKLVELDDPFGAKMRTEEKDGKLRIWSVGKDGVDDGGTGDWKAESKDIVLDLKK